jgi:pimeloyl-ACP methyl ester carboxylesterase
MSSHVQYRAPAPGAARPTVICLHASGSTGNQWRALAARLEPRFRVIAPDLYGHGIAPAYSGTPAGIVTSDTARIASLVADAGGPVYLVGHSYGGAIALRVALRQPQAVVGAVVYEPVTLRVLFDYHGRHPLSAEIRRVAQDIRRMLDAGDPTQAARGFVDYWSGDGRFDALEPAQQAILAARMDVIHAHFEGLAADELRLHDYKALAAPVLLMSGRNSRLPTRRIGELLRFTLPRSEEAGQLGMGHLGPVTHPEAVATVAARFVYERDALRTIQARVAA